MTNHDTDAPKLEVSFSDEPETRGCSPARRYILTASAARMVVSRHDTGKTSHIFSWPTEIHAETVVSAIGNAGNILRSAYYGYGGISAKLTVTVEDRTPRDTNSADTHTRLVKGFIQEPPHLEKMRELDTHTADWKDGIGWFKKWDDPDHLTDQFEIKTSGYIDLTERWVRRLIESTASEPWLQENTSRVTDRFQEIFLAEQALNSIPRADTRT